MTTAAQKNTAQSKDKAKRKMLTPQERIAKAEQDLKDLRAKAEEKDRKSLDALIEKRNAAADKAAAANTVLSKLDAEVEATKKRLGLTDEAPATPDSDS